MAVVILHGTKGSPAGNWFPWLKDQLALQGTEVLIPKFPTPEDQTLSNWFSVFDQHTALTSSSILIGHSCGAVFALRLLERSKVKVKKTILVAGLTNQIGIPEYDLLNESFVKGGFDWDKIKNSSTSFAVLCGSNDPYVPFEQAQELSNGLGCALTVIQDGGHLNAEVGMTSFPAIIPYVS